MATTKVLVAGNGMTSLKFVEELLAVAPGRFEITVIGEEPEPAYNRVLLSPLLAGEISTDDVAMKPRHWYGDNGVALSTGVAIEAIDAKTRTARLSNGITLAFDVCVLATGSEPIRLDVPGAGLDGVEVFRALPDIARMASAAMRGQKAVVIGGGLLGIEAAYGLKRAGADVTLIHLMDRLMERQLDSVAAGILKSALEDKGIDVVLKASTAIIAGTSSVEGLQLTDGRVLPASLVMMAVGIKPRKELAVAAGLNCGRGIIVDDHMQTSAPGIYAIGECVEHRGAVYGLVEPGYEQARVAAHAISGAHAGYQGTVLATNLKVSGVPVFSAGDFMGEACEVIAWSDEANGSYRKFVVKDERLTGVVMIGDTTDALWYRDLIRAGERITAFRQALAFGRAYAEAA